MNKIIEYTASMVTNDGVKLASDIYRLDTNQKLPVLLMRQPYGKTIASTVVYAHPRWYAQNGYIVVIQDVKGRGDSEGEFELFSNEIKDTEETINWVSRLEGSNGKVGMYGFSYQGMTQLYGAISQHEALKTICPSMVAFDLYSDWAYENGVFCYQINLAWAIQLALETARLKRDLSAYKLLYLASRNLPVHDIPLNLEKALKKYCPSNFYYQWLNHPEKDRYWQDLSPQTYFKNIDLPMLHIGGWFDPYLRGTFNLYQHMKCKSKFQQCLVVGAWGHIPWGNSLGNHYYTTANNNNINELQIAWFDKYLKGKENPNFPKQNINLFQMGSNQWLNFDTLNRNNTTTFYLNSTGLANLRDDDGKLITDNQLNNNHNEDIIVHDWWQSIPSLGGHAMIPAGSFDRSKIDNYSDVITYTSAFLTDELDIIGQIKLELFLEADAEEFDLSVVVSQVFTDGKVYNFTQTQAKIKQVDLEKAIVIKLQPTCIKLAKNTALRLSLSTGAFPAYKDLSIEEKFNAQPMTIKVLSGKQKPSRLLLVNFS